MTLNYECLRDTLLALEKHLSIAVDRPCSELVQLSFTPLSLDRISKLSGLSTYSIAEIFYVLHNLQQAHFIDAEISVRCGLIDGCVVRDITYEGHMFLKNISNDTIWKQLKKKLGPAFTASLPVIQQLAGQLILFGLGVG